MGAIGRFLVQLVRKLAFALLLVGLGTVGFALWNFLHDRADFELRREEILRTLTAETAKLHAALAEVDGRMAGTRAEIAAQRDRAALSAKVARDLEDFGSGLDRVTTDPAQLLENDARKARMKQMETAARQSAAEHEKALARTQWERDGLDIALARMEVQLRTTEENKSVLLHYLQEAWQRDAPYLLALAACYLLVPTAVRIFSYYFVAPEVASRPPVLLGKVGAQQSDVSTGRLPVDLQLLPGTRLRLRPKYLHVADDRLTRRTRRFFDWRRPITCRAAGLTKLIELRNESSDQTYQATVADRESPAAEAAVIMLPAGVALVLRPTYLAGAIGVTGQRLAVRTHWRLLALRSWVTGQFRHFEFRGPGRLFVAGGYGVRAEVLVSALGQPAQVRRFRQGLVVGFTPGLSYQPVRTESFLDYFRGKRTLYDDVFTGQGVVLFLESPIVEMPGPGGKRPARVGESLRHLLGL